MTKERHVAIEAALRLVIEDLQREEDELRDRVDVVHDAKCELAHVWSAFGLGPLPGAEEFYERQKAWREIADEALARPFESSPELLEQLMESATGITERIRIILEFNPNVELSPMQVRDLLVQSGFSLEGRSNPMAEIHLILKRIASKRKSRITKRETESGTLYKYNRAPSVKPDKGA